MRVSILAAALALLLAAAAPPAVRAEGDNAVPYDGLSFDDPGHRRWYARFWTGECRDLSLFVCLPGRPYWHETMRRLAATASPERRQVVTQRLFLLGKRIGHEWAKANDVRKISTDHIRAWYRELDAGGDPEPLIARIEAEATRLLAGR